MVMPSLTFNTTNVCPAVFSYARIDEKSAQIAQIKKTHKKRNALAEGCARARTRVSACLLKKKKCQQRPIGMEKEACILGNETFWYCKRGLCTREKRPIDRAKETYREGKRDLLRGQKRPIARVKETY
jgi:hypothetical protein